MLLIDGLINSLDEPDPNIDRLWNEEAQRRLEACRSGKMKTLSMEEVLIKSVRAALRFKNSPFKAQIAAHSTAISKICNAEGVIFGLKAAGHGLIQHFLNPRNLSWKHPHGASS